MTAPLAAPAPRTGLTTAEISHWRTNGYVAVPDFFTAAEVGVLQAEVGALQAAGKLRNVVTVGDGKTHSTTAFNLQICPVGPVSRPIRALAHAAKVRAAIIGLLGDSAVQHLDQIFLKPARHGVGTNWHTDNSYFRSSVVSAGTGMWIAVHPASIANGTMRIIPGSHLAELPHVRDGGSDHHITCAAAVDEAAALPIELPAGGVLFFNYGVAHATGANATDHDRAGLALHFVQEEHLQDRHFNTNRSNAAQWRIGPASDGGRTAFGEDLRGVWESLVAG